MTFNEATIELLQHPGWVALLPPDRMIGISDTGYLMSLGGAKPDYCRVRMQDLLAATWEVMSPEQLQELATRTAGGE